jgi:hypothetical protein
MCQARKHDVTITFRAKKDAKSVHSSSSLTASIMHAMRATFLLKLGDMTSLQFIWVLRLSLVAIATYIDWNFTVAVLTLQKDAPGASRGVFAKCQNSHC